MIRFNQGNTVALSLLACGLSASLSAACVPTGGLALKEMADKTVHSITKEAIAGEDPKSRERDDDIERATRGSRKGKAAIADDDEEQRLACVCTPSRSGPWAGRAGRADHTGHASRSESEDDEHDADNDDNDGDNDGDDNDSDDNDNDDNDNDDDAR